MSLIALKEILRLLESKYKTGHLPIYGHKSGGRNRKPIAIAGLEPYFRRGFFYYHPKSQDNFLEEYLEFSPDIGSRKVS